MTVFTLTRATAANDSAKALTFSLSRSLAVAVALPPIQPGLHDASAFAMAFTLTRPEHLARGSAGRAGASHLEARAMHFSTLLEKLIDLTFRFTTLTVSPGPAPVAAEATDGARLMVATSATRIAMTQLRILTPCLCRYDREDVPGRLNGCGLALHGRFLSFGRGNLAWPSQTSFTRR